MQDGTYPPRNFATFGPSELQPPFTEVYVNFKKKLNFSLQHWAGVRFYTTNKFAESCVFNKQSLPSFFFNFLSLFYPEVTKAFCRVPSEKLE